MTDGRPGAAEWVSFALICGSALLSALLELMFLSEFYIGTVIVPVVVIAAIVGNLVLPRWGMSVLGTPKGAIVPLALWLLVIVVPALYMRPEGDLFVLGAQGQQYAYYGLLLGGATAGFATIVLASGASRR